LSLLITAVFWVGCLTVGPIWSEEPNSPATSEPPFPLGERFTYNIKFMGVHCGAMTLESFTSDEGGETFYHVVMTARSSKFFDGIYRVRSRIESWFSAESMSTVRYHNISNEKKDHTDDLFELDLEAGEIVRTKNGNQETLTFEATGGVHDPLAYLYRLRTMVGEPGDEVALTLMTSNGAVETIADVVEKKRISTALGKRDAVRVVPRPKDEMLFAKKGQMSVWYGTAETGIPYRVVFDLAFGKLIARLTKIEELSPDDPPLPIPE
jgi:hypothetical protein